MNALRRHPASKRGAEHPRDAVVERPAANRARAGMVVLAPLSDAASEIPHAERRHVLLHGEHALGLHVADRDFKASHVNFPEEVAYRLVKLAAANGQKLMLTMNIWQTWSREMMVAGLSEENTHPGAIRAFKELGWPKPVCSSHQHE